MKASYTILLLTFGLLLTTSCTTRKNNDVQVENKEETISVTGTVMHTENGKDGYMATIKSEDGKDYVATISIVNLGRNAGSFKKYEVGDKIKVKGPFWKDEEGKVHITVRQLN
ncbi:hypothetical protein SAMN05443633_1187 [Chryseobacterium arachidis]|uniref:tRNA_anti-like n=1 Tax=Chryseobacterium arachidis TaxID=1416778 RepID=A0A1M5KZ69_9FLAO|nr:hypothetical protein SAMN05443633_1187 [Chryseobacterium arachidis]